MNELLSLHPDLKKEWESLQLLEDSLRSQEVEEPGMRFSRNVMDQLPTKYQKIEPRPLFSRKIGLNLGLFLTLSVLLGVGLPTMESDTSPSPFLQAYLEFWQQLPSETLVWISMLSVTFVVAALLDHSLARRFWKGS